jgi:hypothetical protein
VAAVLSVVCHGDARAAMINAKSASFADVKSAVSQASEGDTVVIPAGTASWTSYLVITKGITLQGQTTTDAVANTANDQTIILDDVSRGGGCALISAPALTSSQSCRITGITFKAGSVTDPNSNGTIQLNGDCPSVRVDHCHFKDLYAVYLLSTGSIYGVIDHNIFDAGNHCQVAQIHGTGYGDVQWAAPTQFGGPNFMFFEDNRFNNNFFDSNGTQYQTIGVIDCYAGGRYVARHNWFNGVSPLTNHGWDSSGRLRSSRAIEVYENNISANYATSGGQSRGGCLLFYKNTITGKAGGAPSLTCYRMFIPGFVDGASGSSPWDVNDTTDHTGNGFGGSANGLYASGRAKSGSHSGAKGFMTKTGAHWATNQWAGCELSNPKTKRNSFIVSNTNDTLTYVFDSGFDPNGNLNFANGDPFEIRKVLIAMDQPGRGQGDLLANNPPINTKTGTAAWPHQALEPCYFWKNTLNGQPTSGTSIYPNIQEGRDYYNGKPMPGYTPFTYPHPLLTGSGNRRPSSEASPSRLGWRQRRSSSNVSSPSPKWGAASKKRQKLGWHSQ